MSNDPQFSDMLGLTLNAIVVNDEKDEMAFIAADGSCYRLYHREDCCEHVTIDDICGDLPDLVGHPLLQAEEVTFGQSERVDDKPEGAESWTWTFYKLATIKGSVTIKWLGESNGYYSERVSFDELLPAAGTKMAA